MDVVEQFMRPRELIQLLGLSKSRIYQLIATGAIPSVRLGGAIRIPRAAWRAWLASQSVQALSALQGGPPVEIQAHLLSTGQQEVLAPR
jgi:excisionase family DNA binding protein